MLNTRREVGDVGIQGGTVPRPQLEPHPECCRTPNLTLGMHILGQGYPVK